MCPQKSRDKNDYEAPQLTVVSFKMERGYAVSINNGLGLIMPGELELEQERLYGDKALEDRSCGGNWGGTNGWF